MYELYDPCTVMFFFRNKVRPDFPSETTAAASALPELLCPRCLTVLCGLQHIMIDLGTGNNNKVGNDLVQATWPFGAAVKLDQDLSSQLRLNLKSSS